MHDISTLVFTASRGPSTSLLLSPEECAASINVKRATFFKMLARGEIASIKVGKLRRIPVQCLQDWLERKMQEHGIRDRIPPRKEGEKQAVPAGS